MVTKKCESRDFPPEELEKLISICVYEVNIGLQHPVGVNAKTHLTSDTVPGSVNMRDSGMEWIHNITPEGNNFNRLSCINMVINVYFQLSQISSIVSWLVFNCRTINLC